MKRQAEDSLARERLAASVKWTQKDKLDAKRSLAKLSKDFPLEDFAEERAAAHRLRELEMKLDKIKREKEERERKMTINKESMSGAEGEEDEVVLYDEHYRPPEKKARVADTSLAFKPYTLHVGIPYWVTSGGKGNQAADSFRMWEDDINNIGERIAWLLNRHRNRVGSRSSARLQVAVYTLGSMGLPKDVVEYQREKPGFLWNRAMLNAFIDRWILGKPPHQVPGYHLLDLDAKTDNGRPLDMWIIPTFSDSDKPITTSDGKVIKAHLNIKREKEWMEFDKVTEKGVDVLPAVPYTEVLEHLVTLSPLFAARRVFFWYPQLRRDLFYRRLGEDTHYTLRSLEQVKKQLYDDSRDTPVILATNGNPVQTPPYYNLTPVFKDEKGDPVPIKDRMVELKPEVEDFIQKWNIKTAHLLWSLHPEVVARQVGQLQKLDLGLSAFKQDQDQNKPALKPDLRTFPSTLVGNVKSFMGKADLKEGESKRGSLAIGVIGLSNDPLVMSRVEAVVGLIYKYGGKFLPPGAGIEFVCLDQLPLTSEDDGKEYFFTKDDSFHKGSFMEELFLQYASDKTTVAETRRIDVWMLDYPGLSRSVAGYDYDSTSIKDHVLAFHHLVETKVSTERIFAFKKQTDAGGTGLGATPLQFDKQAQTYVTAVDNSKRRIRVLYEGADEEVVGNCLKWILQKHPDYKQAQMKALPKRVPDDMRDIVSAFTAMKFQSSSR